MLLSPGGTRPRFGVFSPFFDRSAFIKNIFACDFLLGVYRQTKRAEMETLKLDGSCEVLTFNLFVVSKLPSCDSDLVYGFFFFSFFNVAIPQQLVK